MQRPCFINPSAFRHSTAGTPSRRHQDDLTIGMQAAVDLQNRFQHRRFTGTRRACDDGKIMAVGCMDCRLLFRRQRQPHFPLDPLQNLFDPLRSGQLHHTHSDSPGGFVLLREHTRQIDLLIDGNYLTVQDHILKHINNFLLMEPKRRDGDLCVQHPECLFAQNFASQKQMPLTAFAVLQRPKQRAFDTHRVVQVASVFLDDGVYPQKAEAGHLTKLEWTLFQDIHTGRAKILIDFLGCLWRDLKRGEQGHQILQHTALRIRGLNILQLSLRNAPDFQQTLRMVLQDVQRFHTKPRNDLCGGRRPNAFDKSRGQITFYAALGPWDDLMPLFHLKLHPVLSFFPFAIQLQLYRVRAGQLIAGRHKPDQVILVPARRPGFLWHILICCLYADDTELVCGIVVDRPIISSFMDQIFPSFLC